MKKQCAKCHNEFECHPEDVSNCHCSTVELTPLQLAQLRQTYNDCLCSQCLAEIGKKKENKD